MTWFGRLALAFSLAADAFAASLCIGAETGSRPGRNAWKAGLLFGGFQGLMPVLGYFFSGFFRDSIRSFSGLVSFLLLGFLGVRMIRAGLAGKTPDAGGGSLLAMAFATSADAWAAGIPLALKGEPIWVHLITISLVTGLLSAGGVFLGARIGSRHRRAAEITGGVILILLGLRFWIGAGFR